MYKVMISSPDLTHGTSFYRCVGPWSRLAKDRPGEVEIIYHHETNWATLTQGDLLFVQRPFTGRALKMMEYAKCNGIPVWVDYDDYVFAVPEDNPAFGLYAQETTRETIKKCMRLADVVTVTNAFLKEKYSVLSGNIRILKNALDLKLLNFRPAELPERNKTLIWRGNSSHQRDINLVQDELIGLSHSEAFTGWKVLFMGFSPWHIIDRMKEGTAFRVPLKDIMEYFQFLMSERPAAILSPLTDIPLNRGRSNISYLESAFVGAVNVCKNFPDFNLPGAATFRDKAEFGIQVARVLAGAAASDALQAWEHVRSHETLEIRNRERYQILQELLG